MDTLFETTTERDLLWYEQLGVTAPIIAARVERHLDDNLGACG
jgi:hypothetical protein